MDRPAIQNRQTNNKMRRVGPQMAMIILAKSAS